MADPRDQTLGRLAVERGLLTPDQLKSCLSELDRDRVPLGFLLLRRNLLTLSQLEQLMNSVDSADATLKPAAGEAKRAREEAFTEEVRSALASPDNIVGKFVRVKLLGKGGMGTVHKAYDMELRRYVALKTLLVEGDPGEVERFKLEAQAAAGLQHPNIVQVYEIGVHRGVNYIAMEFIEGVTLNDFIALNPPMEERLRILEEAARAMHVAHTRGIVHRDLKPGNIMISADRRVYVMDFGLAKQVKGSTSAPLTVSGMILGTPSYMSPEQARGSTREITPLSDVYALGATLYHAVSGGPPFQDSDVYKIVSDVIDKDPPALPRTVPQDVRTIVAKALSKEPRMRYASAQDFADDVRRFLDGEPIQARPTTLVYRALKRIRKRALVYSLYAALGASVLIAGGIFFVKERQRSRLEKEQRERDRRHADARAFLAEAEKLWQDAQALLSNPELGSEGLKKVRSRVEAALLNAESASQAAPELPEPYYLLGILHQQIGDRAAAARDLDLAIQAGPKFDAAKLAKARLILDDILESEQVLGVLGEPAASSKREGIAKGMPELLSQIRSAELKAAEQSLLVVLLKIAQGDKEAAIAQALRAAESEDGPPKGDLLDLAGSIEWSRGRWREAETHQSSALRHRPNSATVHYHRGIVRGVLKKHRDAWEDYTRAIDIAPRFASAYYERAQLSYFWLSGTGSPISDIDEYVRLEPAAIRGHDLRSTILLMESRFVEAEADASRLTELDPASDLGYVRRAQIRLSQKRYDLALQDWDTAIRRRPASAENYLGRGDTYQAMQEFGKAIADYEKSVLLNALLYEPHERMGVLYYRTKEFEKSRESLSRAVERSPRFARLYHLRARTLLALGRVEEAEKDWTKALELAPREADFLQARGQFYESRGEFQKALDDYERALENRAGLRETLEPRIRLCREKIKG